MAVQIQLRRGTAAEWTSANPILAVAEIGVETDTDQFKLGDGVTAWNSLGYGGIVGPAGTFSSTQTITNLSANYTIQASDAGKLFTNSAAITVTVDNLSAGQQVDFIQTGAGQITFTPGQGRVIDSKNSNLKTAAQYSPASLKCIAGDVYVLLGDLGA